MVDDRSPMPRFYKLLCLGALSACAEPPAQVWAPPAREPVAMAPQADRSAAVAPDAAPPIPRSFECACDGTCTSSPVPTEKERYDACAAHPWEVSCSDTPMGMLELLKHET